MKRILLGLVLLVCQMGAAQVAFDQANSLRLARYTELMRIRMTALQYEPSAEQAQALLEEDLPFFAGSLEGINPNLLQKLQTALEDVQTLAQKGRNLNRMGRKVNALLRQAQQTLIPAKTRADPAFQAALIVEILTLEGGVAESYDEAANGEDEAYILAWVGLQQVKVLWQPLKRKWRGSEAVKKADEAFRTLDELMLASEPPDRFKDPEDAERAVLDISFALEQGAAKTLAIQDLSKPWDLVYSRSNQACKASEKGQQNLALEWMAAANFYYQQYLTAPLQTLEPALHNQLSPLLEEQLSTYIEQGAGIKGACAKLQALLEKARAVIR